MSRETWNAIKQSKRFYVNTYRRASRVLMLSVAINLLLVLGIAYVYFNQPERDFYSTSGITPPVGLTTLDEPNYSERPLLANDPVNENQAKQIPR